MPDDRIGEGDGWSELKGFTAETFSRKIYSSLSLKLAINSPNDAAADVGINLIKTSKRSALSFKFQ